MWFRADLRTADNPALNHACSRAVSPRGVMGVFTICPEQWRTHDWSAVKVEFIRRTLVGLKRDLWKLNIPLKVIVEETFESVPSALLELARKHECAVLVYNREYEVHEAARDEAVNALFVKNGLDVRAFTDQVLVPPGSIRTSAGDFYSVYTPFRKKWLSIVEEGGLPPVLPAPKRLESRGASGGDDIPDDIQGFDGGGFSCELWPIGEQAGQTRLQQFVNQGLEDYASARDVPAMPGTSQISPYLAIGALSVKQCLAAAREANGGSLNGGRTGAAVWIGELIWREFYRHVLVGWPRVCRHQPFRERTDAIAWRTDEADFSAWCAGRTGVPIVDAGMRQLNATGWMHNRLRMIVAMYLTKGLLIDWRWGERYFMQHLIDGDLASNNGGWQWSASTGTDASPYFRVFNPYTQSRKCDPDATFIREWVKELRDIPAKKVHDPTKWDDEMRDGLDYPRPLVDHADARARVIAAFKALD